MRARLIEIATTTKPVSAASAASSAVKKLAHSGVSGNLGPLDAPTPRSGAEGERALPLAHVARMPERVAPGLRPDGEPVRLAADGNGLDQAVVGVEGVDDAVIAAREPQPFAVGGEVAHVRAAAAGNRPVGDDLTCRKVDHRHASRTPSRAAQAVGSAIGDVELGSVATRIEPVRTDAGLDEIELPERIAVDHHDPVAQQVRDEEKPALGCDPN